MAPLSQVISVPYRLADTVLSTTLAAGSALRRGRIFHPDGVAHRATVRIEPTQRGYGVRLLDEQRSYDALVRFSRGAGLPDGLPDILGLAIRIVDAHGLGAHQDLLVNTALPSPVVRHVFMPALGFRATYFSSILPYDVGGRTLLFGAKPLPGARGLLSRLADVHAAAASGTLGFSLLAASPLGRWRRIGVLEVGSRLSDADAEELRFDIDNTGGGIAPVGVLQDLRRSAYRRSQAVRP